MVQAPDTKVSGAFCVQSLDTGTVTARYTVGVPIIFTYVSMKNWMNCACGGKWGEFGPFFLRVVVGLIFAMHGWQKLETGIPGVSGFLGSLGFPAPEFFAVLLIAAELGGGILLILGAFTHWVAKILVIVSVVALVTVHLGKGFFLATGGYEFILLILAATVSVMVTGGGKWSLDHTLLKR